MASLLSVGIIWNFGFLVKEHIQTRTRTQGVVEKLKDYLIGTLLKSIHDSCFTHSHLLWSLKSVKCAGMETIQGERRQEYFVPVT